MDLDKHTQVPIKRLYNDADSASAICWLKMEEDPYFMYGTGLGHMVICARSLLKVSKVCL